MKGYDWIVIGNGLTGAATGYELARLGASVLIVEQAAIPDSATQQSYGGIPYWMGTTPTLNQLCQEGIDRHRQFAEELEYDTEFRELDALMTVSVDHDLEAIAQSCANLAIPPTPLDRDEACAVEPLLNREAIAGALRLPHAHVNPDAMVRAYNHGMQRHHGTIQISRVTGLLREGDRITGVTTSHGPISGDRVLVCAGGWARQLLNEAGISIRQYFTHAESINCPASSHTLRTLIMPALVKRYAMEAEAGHPHHSHAWDQPGQELYPAILDPGAIQFRDGHIRMGQVSRVLTNPAAAIDAHRSEQDLRHQVGTILPALKTLPGRWTHCLVAFTEDSMPLVGAIPSLGGLYIFSGFGGPFVLVPPIAQRFAAHVAGSSASSASDLIIDAMRPDRFRP